MTTTTTIDIRDMVLSTSAFGPREIEQLQRSFVEDPTAFGTLRDAVAELEMREDTAPATAVRLGVCYYLLGRYRRALETLATGDGGALARFYLGKTNSALGNHKESMQHYSAAKAAGYAGDDCALALAEAQRNVGANEAALATLDALSGAVEQTAEYLYQRAATVAALRINPEEAVRLFERAVASDERHPGALFGLAVENDRRGNDETALSLYQRAAACFPAHVGSLLNLGVLYEDRGNFDRAQVCYQRVLDAYPDNLRARLFLKDAAASSNMLYDEETQKRNDRLAQVLSVPVTDFELSMRARNCLQKMGIRTLGDLTRTTEAELLASKNFGETSLQEIREMLRAKGLELGQFSHEKSEPEPVVDVAALPADAQAILDRPISDLNLSVRARKCMVRLGMTTISELIRRTGDDLLECKNFGVTSLNEVREKLVQFGLKLRGD